MNIESIPKFFAPKGMHISDSGRATASEQLTVTDVMAALGMTQAEAGIGLSMFWVRLASARMTAWPQFTGWPDMQRRMLPAQSGKPPARNFLFAC